MNRDTWKTLYRRMRKAAGNGTQAAMIDHGGTYWTVEFTAQGRDTGLRLVPSIIRDRAPSARIADELEWTRRFRLEAKTHRRNGSYYAQSARNSIAGAKACIADCRDIRLSGSALHMWI